MRALRTIDPGAGVLRALEAALAGGDAILVGRSAGVRPDGPAAVPEAVALVVETSGSTGTPKRVALSADALRANTEASEAALGGPGRWVLALPTHYIAGINVLARSLAAGTTPVAVEGEHFTAAGFVAAARRLGATDRFVSLVPAQLATLLDDPAATEALATFRAALVGGQSLPAAVRERAAAAGIRVVRSYGSSETSGGCVYDGVPIGGTRVCVVDGEVHLGGPGLAEGYLGDPALTAERFVDVDGMRWFRTADAGTWNGTRLEISGRRDDVVISGGIKVSLGAVESLLHEHGFPEAVVVRGAHARWGEAPVAFVTRDADPARALAAIEAALGPAGRPRVRRVSVIPSLASGKPDRVALEREANG